MNTWSILGWVVLALVTSWAFRVVALITHYTAEETAKRLANCLAYRKYRGLPPLAGQIWVQGGKAFRVVKREPDGDVVLSSENTTWVESYTEWRERVRRFKRVFVSYTEITE